MLEITTNEGQTVTGSQVAGLSLSTFGLELDTVISQLAHESSYSIFYILCEASNEESTGSTSHISSRRGMSAVAGLDNLKLRDAASFNYLCRQDDAPYSPTESVDRFIALNSALEALGDNTRSPCARSSSSGSRCNDRRAREPLVGPGGYPSLRAA